MYVEQVRWLPGAMDPAREHPDVFPLWTELAALLEPQTPEAVDRGLSFAAFVPVDIVAVNATV